MDGSVRVTAGPGATDPRWMNSIYIEGFESDSEGPSRELIQYGKTHVDILQSAFVGELISDSPLETVETVAIDEEVEVTLRPVNDYCSGDPARVVARIRPDLGFVRTRCETFDAEGKTKELWVALDFVEVDANLPSFPKTLIHLKYWGEEPDLRVIKFESVELNPLLPDPIFAIGEDEGFSLRDAKVYDSILGISYAWGGGID